MKITGIRLQLCHFPLPQPFNPSWLAGFPQATNGCAIYRLQTDEGIEGVTASPLVADEAKGTINLLRATLIGRDPTQVEDIFKILRSATRSLGLRSWHLEPACWDIIGKAANQPVWKLLGGARNRLRAYCSFGEVRDGKQRIDDVAHVKELGFTAAKLRVRSMTIDEDVEQVRLVREAHPDFTLMVDANMGWRVHGFAEYPEWDVSRAVRFAKQVEPYDIEWLEEPLDQFDYEGYAELRRQTSIPLAAGEMLSDLHGFRDLIGHRSVDIVQPDATLSGGILMSRKVASMAEGAGLRFNPHTWTNGIGLRINMQVMGAVANCDWCEFPYDPPAWIPKARDAMLAEPTRVDAEGFITLPDHPGLGIELDEGRIAGASEEL